MKTLKNSEPVHLALRSLQQTLQEKNAHLEQEIAERLRVEEKLRQYTLELEKEKQESDRLLRSILPASVAQDLKETGKSKPRVFNHVTIFFSDIVDFTALSHQTEPEALIDKLNEIFTAFDRIMEKNGCERIKTIGDAYMAVCGMPLEDERHAQKIVQSAIEIISYLHEHNRRIPVPWRMRIGIHSGSAVGGVVGVKKYIYDVFGDTVNIAKKMESHSKPMRINISEATHDLIKDQFACNPRGQIKIKGKGKMPMYFVNP
jgi:class 3 adenylate cyclase